MGCGASKVHAAPRFKMPKLAPEFEMLDLEYSTPMLVMPYPQFKAQGRIMKSVKKWRDEALEKVWLVEFEVGSGKVAIFISHTWWHRARLGWTSNRGVSKLPHNSFKTAW